MTITLGLLALIRTGPEPESPEVAAAAIIDAGLEGLEGADADAIMALVSDDFRATLVPLGTTDREQLRRYLALRFLRYGPVNAQILSRDIEVRDPSSVVIRLRVIVSQGGLRGVLDGRTDATHVDLLVNREGSEWRITSIEGRGLAREY